MRFYVLREKPFDWGDYGSILIHGLRGSRSSPDEPLQLKRTGPFIPPISLPWSAIVCTNAAKEELREAFPSLKFGPVLKTHIVRLQWENWDQQALEPKVFPESGEPEDYVLEQPHCPKTAEELGTLWELIPQIIPGIQRGRGLLDVDQWDGSPLFKVGEVGLTFVTNPLRDFMMEHYSEFIELKRAGLFKH